MEKWGGEVKAVGFPAELPSAGGTHAAARFAAAVNTEALK